MATDTDSTNPLPIPDQAPWDLGDWQPETSLPSDKVRKALKDHTGLSTPKILSYEEELRFLDARRRQIEAMIRGEITEAQPLHANFPSPENLVDWLKPIRKEAQEAQGAGRRIRVWLCWFPETKEVLLRRDPLVNTLRVSALIGPNTSLPTIAANLLETLERDAKALLRKYGLKGAQDILRRRSASPKLGRLPSLCTKAFPSLEEVADMVTRFRRDKLNLADPLEEGQYAKIISKEERDERFAQGVILYGLYRPETGKLQLVTPLMLEKFRSHAQALGHWPFLVCQATWRKYQNARQVAGFLRRDLCRVYQEYVELCKKEVVQAGAEVEHVEVDGLKVPSIAVVVDPPLKKGKVFSEGKVYKTTEDFEYYDSPESNTDGVIMPSHLQHIRNLRNKR